MRSRTYRFGRGTAPPQSFLQTPCAAWDSPSVATLPRHVSLPWPLNPLVPCGRPGGAAKQAVQCRGRGAGDPQGLSICPPCHVAQHSLDVLFAAGGKSPSVCKQEDTRVLGWWGQCPACTRPPLAPCKPRWLLWQTCWPSLEHSVPSTQVAEVPGWHRHSLEQPLPPGRAVSPGPAEADAPLPTVPRGPSP